MFDGDGRVGEDGEAGEEEVNPHIVLANGSVVYFNQEDEDGELVGSDNAYITIWL